VPNVASPELDPPTSDLPSSPGGGSDGVPEGTRMGVPQADRVGAPQAVNNLRHPSGSHLGQRPTSRSQWHSCVVASHAIEAGRW